MKAPAPYNKREVGPPGIYQLAPTIATLRSEWTKTGGGGGEIEHPFQIQAGTAALAINVRYGTMQDNEPTGVATEQAITDDATNYVYLDLEVDLNGVFVACTLTIDTSPQPADSDYHGYITLGNVVAAGGIITVINQACTHSLRFAMCGRVVDGETLVEPGTYEFWGF